MILIINKENNAQGKLLHIGIWKYFCQVVHRRKLLYLQQRNKNKNASYASSFHELNFFFQRIICSSNCIGKKYCISLQLKYNALVFKLPLYTLVCLCLVLPLYALVLPLCLITAEYHAADQEFHFRQELVHSYFQPFMLSEASNCLCKVILFSSKF